MSVSALNWAATAVATAIALIAIWQAARRSTEKIGGLTYYARESSKKLNGVHKAFNFMVRKLYKEVLLLFGSLSVVAIIWSDAVLNIPNIEPKDELSIIALVITAFIIFWYTRETYDLKQNSNKELKSLEKAQKDEFLPVVVPEDSGIIQGNGADMKIRNIGKGLAKNVTVKIGSFTVDEGFSIIPNRELFPVVVRQCVENIKNLTEKEKPNEIHMDIEYSDIYDRRFRTVGVLFIRSGEDSENKYTVQKGNWTYQFLDRSGQLDD